MHRSVSSFPLRCASGLIRPGCCWIAVPFIDHGVPDPWNLELPPADRKLSGSRPSNLKDVRAKVRYTSHGAQTLFVGTAPIARTGRANCNKLGPLASTTYPVNAVCREKHQRAARQVSKARMLVPPQSTPQSLSPLSHLT